MTREKINGNKSIYKAKVQFVVHSKNEIHEEPLAEGGRICYFEYL